MYKKIFVAMSLALLSQITFADKCPSVQDIKDRNIQGWTAYDSEDGSRLTPRRWNRFRNNIQEFAMAEWIDENHKGGTIHCYYRNKDGADLEAFLARNRFSPNNGRNLWYQVSGSWQCAAGWEKCEFDRANVPHRRQIANQQNPQQQLQQQQQQGQQNYQQTSNYQQPMYGQPASQPTVQSSMQSNMQPSQATVPPQYPQQPQR